MVPNSALELRNRVPTTPYKADNWYSALKSAHILSHFHDVPLGLHQGFVVDFPIISHIQLPPNKISINLYVH